nr:G1 [uncultured bacterium]
MNQGGGSAKVDWNLPGHVLTSITAYRFWNWKPRNDADGTALPVLTEAYNESKQRQFTQEVRLASAGKNTIDYVVGAFYFHQKLDSHALTSYGSAAPIWLLGQSTVATQAALNGFAVTGDSRLRTNSYAAFGQGTWNISDRLALTVGARYTKEKKTGSFVQTVDGPDLSGLSPTDLAIARGSRAAFGAPNAYTNGTKESKLSGQANLSYKFSDGVLGYATYAHGFKSGGLTLTNVGPTVPTTIEPESIDHYEVGLKTRTADQVLTVNVAAFWTIDKNYQATLYDPIKTTTYVSNVGKVRSRGIEAEGSVKLAEGLTAYGAVTYLDAKYLSFKNSTCPIEIQASFCDLSGRVLPGAPKWSGAVGGEYSHPVTPDVEAYVGFDYSYRSSIYYASNLAASSRIPGYSLVNARVGARIDERFDVSVWARNLFNKDYFSTLQPAAFNTGLVSGVLGDPRVIGFTGRVRF